MVWDMRALVATQQLQLSLPPHVSVTALAALPPYRQLLVAARRLSCFQACALVPPPTGALTCTHDMHTCTHMYT